MPEATLGRRFLPGLFAALLLVASSAQAAGRYMIEMALWIEGSKQGEPMLIVETGEPAEISSTDPEGESGWKIELEVEPSALSEGKPAGVIWLRLSIFQLVDGNWEYLTDSLAGVPEGDEYSMSVAGSEGGSGRNDALVYLTAVTSRLQPGEK